MKDEICEKRGVSWNGISSGNYRFKIKLENFSFSSSSPTIIGNTNIIYSIIAVLNSKVAPYILNAINPTLQLNVGEILGFPMVDLSEDLLQLTGNVRWSVPSAIVPVCFCCSKSFYQASESVHKLPHSCKPSSELPEYGNPAR